MFKRPSLSIWPRTPKEPSSVENLSSPLELSVTLLRQSIYSRLAGYEDVNDAERLSVDPVMRHVVGGRAADRRAAGAGAAGPGAAAASELQRAAPLRVVCAWVADAAPAGARA